MATIKSDDVKLGYMIQDGPVGVVIQRSVKFSAQPSSGDVVEMVPVPAGAMVTNVGLKWGACVASTTATVGDGADADRYGTPTVTSGGVATYPMANHVYDTNDTVDITFGGANQSSAVSFTMNVDYKMVGGYATNGDPTNTFIACEASAFKNA